MRKNIESLAAELATEFAPRAARYDAENQFPHENFASLRRSGYLAITVPEEFGGGGCRLPELCQAQQILAGGCGATALSANMHIHTLGVAAAIWRQTHDPRLEPFFRAVVEMGVIVAACASEPGTKGGFTFARTRAVPTTGGYRITGRKIICSLSPIMDLVSTNAVLDLNGTRSLLQFVIPRDSPGLTTRETWDAMGMRATGSHELELADVFVPTEAVVLVREVGTYDVHAQEVMKWFALTVGSTYTGIAVAARDHVLGLLGTAEDAGERALRMRDLGEMEVDIAASQALIASSAAAVDRSEFQARPALLKRCLAAKYFATNAALRVVHTCLELAGGTGYLKRSPLERYYRDARAGIIHPPNNRDGLAMIGEIASGAWGPEEQPEGAPSLNGSDPTLVDGRPRHAGAGAR